MTTPDKAALFQLQPGELVFWVAPVSTATPAIGMNDAQMFQAMDGFGYCLRSAQLLHQLALGARAHLLRKLFATDGPNLGVSYLRLNIVVSALDAQVFSHNDRPAGEIAPTLTSLTSSRACLSLVLKNLIYQS